MSVGFKGDTAPGGSPVGRRPRLRRLSVGHLAVAVTAILAFIANLAFLRSLDHSQPVVVAARAVAAGQVLQAADLGTAPVNAEAAVFDSLFTAPESLVGLVAGRPLEPGALITRADVLGQANPAGLASMALPIDPAHAAGGLVRIGDRVDVVDVTRDGGATYVLRDAPVLAVSEGGSGSLAPTGGEHLVVGVTAEQAIAVAEAIADGAVDVIVTTGVGGG